jgi:hypothetical protein
MVHTNSVNLMCKVHYLLHIQLRITVIKLMSKFVVLVLVSLKITDLSAHSITERVIPVEFCMG